MKKIVCFAILFAFCFLPLLSFAQNKVVVVPLGGAKNYMYWQGDWTVDTAYKVGDAVQMDGSSYICTNAHTSTPTDYPPADLGQYWDALCLKGDTGTCSCGISVEEYQALLAQVTTLEQQVIYNVSYGSAYAEVTAAGYTGTTTEMLVDSYTTAQSKGYTGTQIEWETAQSTAITENAADQPLESCSVCHNGSAEYNGDSHQAVYDKTVTDGVDAAGNTYAAALFAPVTNDAGLITLQFTVTVNGTAYTDPTLALFDNISYYAMGAPNTVEQSAGTPVVTFDTDHYVATWDATATSFATITDIIAGVVLRKGKVSPADSPITSRFQPYDVIIGAGGSAGPAVGAFVSKANVKGCEACHGTPYHKHANYLADLIDGKDFLLCKSCHKAGTASHATQGFQLLYDDPQAYADQGGVLTPEQEAKYDTDREFMLDVHMSHNMEFAYPQGMNNCITCHEDPSAPGQIVPGLLTDANFVYKTCQSCHARDNLANRMPHGDPGPTGTACNFCHMSGGIAPVFSQIHNGYNPLIFAADGTKYADAITVSISNPVLSGTDLTFDITAAGTAGTLNSTDIVPAIMIGLYGYGSKDFIVNGHDRWDSNCNGIISRGDGDQPIGEYIVGAEVPGCPNPYWTLQSGTVGSGAWQITAHLATWADMINSGTIKRVELAVMPELEVNAAGDLAGLNAVSETFNLTTSAVEANFFGHDIVDAAKCNTCHAQLATTFHSGDRGGNITVCRMCHVGLSGGSHLEMQSRSIDSYVHGIHSFQAFDPADIANDTLSAMRYNHHIESTYPNFTITNCESCHNPGTYNVPDQAKSMPGKLSAADTMAPGDLLYGRNIGAVPSYDTGPASRACGSCHRAELINEDAAGALASLNQHTKTFGYLEVDGTGVLDKIIIGVMSMF